MAVGDLAAAAGFALVDGDAVDAKDIDLEINRSRDYAAEGKNAATAAQTTASGALPKTDVIASGGPAAPGKVPRYDSGNRFEVGTPQTSFQVANKAYVDSKSGGSYLPISGGDITGSLGVNGNIYTPNASPAATGYVAAYINSDGRISKGASSRRFKSHIRNARLALGSLFVPRLREYRMRAAGDGVYHVGLIAEELDEYPPTSRFVVADDAGRPEAIDTTALLLAMVYELNARLAQLEGED